MYSSRVSRCRAAVGGVRGVEAIRVEGVRSIFLGSVGARGFSVSVVGGTK